MNSCILPSTLSKLVLVIFMLVDQQSILVPMTDILINLFMKHHKKQKGTISEVAENKVWTWQKVFDLGMTTLGTVVKKLIAKVQDLERAVKNCSFKQTFKKYSKLKPFNSSHQPVPKLSEQWQRGFQGQSVFQVLSLKASQKVLRNHNKSIFRTKTQIGAKLDSWNFIKSTFFVKSCNFFEKKIRLNSILKLKCVSRK